jgi:hypothetical protein
MRFLLPSHKPEENTMPDIPNTPLNQLTAWKDNTRRTQNKGFINELTASIKTPRLKPLQNRADRPMPMLFSFVERDSKLCLRMECWNPPNPWRESVRW